MTDDYEPANDYEDQMDGLRLGIYREEDLYCKHGTFVGNSWGPDYMCGPCEMGISDEEWEEGKRIYAETEQKRASARERWAQLIDEDASQEMLLAFLESDEGGWLFR